MLPLQPNVNPFEAVRVAGARVLGHFDKRVVDVRVGACPAEGVSAGTWKEEVPADVWHAVPPRSTRS